MQWNWVGNWLNSFATRFRMFIYPTEQHTTWERVLFWITYSCFIMACLLKQMKFWWWLKICWPVLGRIHAINEVNEKPASGWSGIESRNMSLHKRYFRASWANGKVTSVAGIATVTCYWGSVIFQATRLEGKLIWMRRSCKHSYENSSECVSWINCDKKWSKALKLLAICRRQKDTKHSSICINCSQLNIFWSRKHTTENFLMFT